MKQANKNPAVAITDVNVKNPIDQEEASLLFNDGKIAISPELEEKIFIDPVQEDPAAFVAPTKPSVTPVHVNIAPVAAKRAASAKSEAEQAPSEKAAVAQDAPAQKTAPQKTAAQKTAVQKAPVKRVERLPVKAVLPKSAANAAKPTSKSQTGKAQTGKVETKDSKSATFAASEEKNRKPIIWAALAAGVVVAVAGVAAMMGSSGSTDIAAETSQPVSALETLPVTTAAVAPIAEVAPVEAAPVETATVETATLAETAPTQDEFIQFVAAASANEIAQEVQEPVAVSKADELVANVAANALLALRTRPEPVAEPVVEAPEVSSAAAAPDAQALSSLYDLVVTAHAEGHSLAHIDELINAAHQKNEVNIPEQLVLANGRVDSQTILNLFIAQ